MNKKGKNKKGKTNNPTPIKEKTTEIVEEVVADKESAQTSETIEEKSVSVKEERVPEIVSEVILLSINTKDEETPKKPKRNRGKKKKGADEIDDKCEGDLKATTNIIDSKENTSLLPVEEKSLGNKDIMKEQNDQQKDSSAMAPTARKKKNKKKNVEQTVVDLMLPGPEQISIDENISGAPEETPKLEIKEDIIIDQTITEQEVKSSKKKNKKKKRNDSERSDKDDNACTTAFKKLLDVKDEKVDTKMEESIVHTELAKNESEKIQETLVQETIKEKEMTTLLEATSLKDDNTQQSHPTENKNKKHKKKDKKDIPKEIYSVTQGENLSESVKLSVDETTTEDAPIVKRTEDIVQKHKAKIAKPVEKKRKEKQEPTIIDTPEHKETISEAQQAVELTCQNIITDTELKEKETCEPSDIGSKEIIQIVTEDLTTIVDTVPSQIKDVGMQDVGLQDVEAHFILDKSAGKKRKKGPKIPRVPDVSFEIIETKVDTNLSNIKTDDVIDNLSKTRDILSISATETKVSKNISELRSEVDTLITAESAKVEDHILLTPEVVESKDVKEITTLTSDIVEKNLKTESISSKKRQKSPKPPKKAEIKSQPAELIVPEQDNNKEKTVPVEETKKTEARDITTKLYDIEITSINIDESELPTSDTVPDITYPRSSSQQLPDDNNNRATIREIFPILEITPEAPKQQNIKSSNDDVVVKETKEFSPQKMEKTDLKSKMLEVNQDMEELRLSIERSLAEFTSIEKDEAVAENQYKKSELSSVDNLTVVTEYIDAKKETDLLSTVDTKQSVEETKQEDEKHAHNEGNKIKLESIVSDVSTNEPKKTNPVFDVKVSQSTSTSIAEKLTETLLQFDTKPNNKKLFKRGIVEEIATDPEILMKDKEIVVKESGAKDIEEKDAKIEMPSVPPPPPPPPPICPSRKDQKNKNKKKKGKLDTQTTATQPIQSIQSTSSSQTSATTTSQENKEGDKNKDKKEEKSQTEGKGKQQAGNADQVKEEEFTSDYEPIENFEDALTSSVDDVNQSFEMIVKESQDKYNPKINIIAPDEEKSTVKPSKNLLGHPDIPVRSSKRDYKKEKDKIPNEICAKVKIKDSVEIEGKQTKNTQTINKLKDLRYYKTSENEEFVYKYNFRKVFLQNTCQVCKKDFCASRVACCYCNLVFYCGNKHKDEDWPQHQALCFAVSTIGHLKDQKHIYADAKNITGHDYRLIRMQMIVSCEKILKRRLVPWEQEALLYPRMCAYVPCREWRQMKLTDCQGCAQISFCTDNPDHYPQSHSRWCKSYSLYQKLVSYQQTKGRLEPKLPTKVMQEKYEIPEKINEVLAGMYEEKIDMNDIQYAALTQIATAPLTAAYCHQLCCKKNITANGYKSSTFVIHVVGAELQFEADALNKWEVFFLHLRPDLQHLKVVLINSNLNPSKLPLDLLGKIKLCENCREKRHTVMFSFEERSYLDYKNSEHFILPDIVCAFNPSIQRSSVYNGKDPWPSTVNIIIKQKIPFLITAYTLSELQKDCSRIKECADPDYNFISEPKYNNFASVRPDRNFISDDEMPLLFKNYCFAVICG